MSDVQDLATFIRDARKAIAVQEPYRARKHVYEPPLNFWLVLALTGVLTLVMAFAFLAVS